MKRKKLMKRLSEAKAADVSYASGWESWKLWLERHPELLTENS